MSTLRHHALTVALINAQTQCPATVEAMRSVSEMDADQRREEEGAMLDETSAEPLQAALDAIQKGKTPPPMDDPYTGLPMSRAQRRQMKHKVQKRIKQLQKGKKP